MKSVSVSAVWNDRAIARVRAQLRDAAGRFAQAATVQVGVGGEDADAPAERYDGKKGPATLGEVARWMEFGTATVPERGVLRFWYDQRSEQLREGLIKAVRNHLVLQWAQSIAEELRELYKAGAGSTIAPLAPSTVVERERAGVRSGPALYAIGQLVEAIKARVNGAVADGAHFGWSKLGGR